MLCATTPVRAQRVEDNATAQAEDAFGINIGGQGLGLYDASNVRGFSPVAAGNVRVDGLYFDLQSNFTSRLVGGYRILVGPTVLGHPFPAPSGIADFSLRRPGRRDIVSVSALADSFGSRLVEVDAQLHDVVPNLGLTGGFGRYRYEYGRGGGNDAFSAALTATWKPNPHVEVVPFFSLIADSNAVSEPTAVLATDTSPATPASRSFAGQRWPAGRDTKMNYGATTSVDAGGWHARAGLFRSQQSAPIAFTPLVVNVDASGEGDRLVIAARDGFGGATSGEVQLSRILSDGPRRHRLHLAAWGRDQNRRYGAVDAIPLGRGTLDTPAPSIEPILDFGEQTSDRVRELTIGLGYESQWRGIGVLNLGVQKVHYTKAVRTPDAALPLSRATPWLFNASAGLVLSKSVTAYAGISRGLEESDVAPSTATNRDEAPPAIRSRQVDAGVRWAVAPKLSLTADVFRIAKPYYGLDASRTFRALGDIRHQGFELSLAGSPLPGMSVVAGAVALDAAVSGEQVDTGLVGRRPVGSTPLSVLASVDYRLKAVPQLSVDATVNRDAERVATGDGRLLLPSSALVAVGMRYRFKLDRTPAVLRLQVTNVTNQFTWGIAGSGALQPQAPRQLLARLSADL